MPTPYALAGAFEFQCVDHTTIAAARLAPWIGATSSGPTTASGKLSFEQTTDLSAESQAQLDSALKVVALLATTGSASLRGPRGEPLVYNALGVPATSGDHVARLVVSHDEEALEGLSAWKLDRVAVRSLCDLYWSLGAWCDKALLVRTMGGQRQLRRLVKQTKVILVLEDLLEAPMDGTRGVVQAKAIALRLLDGDCSVPSSGEELDAATVETRLAERRAERSRSAGASKLPTAGQATGDD